MRLKYEPASEPLHMEVRRYMSLKYEPASEPQIDPLAFVRDLEALLDKSE